MPKACEFGEIRLLALSLVGVIERNDVDRSEIGGSRGAWAVFKG